MGIVLKINPVLLFYVVLIVSSSR